MSKSTRVILIALGILGGLTLAAYFLSGPQENLQGRFSFTSGTPNTGTKGTDLLEFIVLSEPGGMPEEGSNEEIFRFALKAKTDLTLDYLSFEVEYEGLLEEALLTPEYWGLREVIKGSVSKPVGEGVLIENGILKLRMNKQEISTGEKAIGYQMKAGEEKIFVLTAHVYDNGIADENSLKVSVPTPSRVDTSTDWVFYDQNNKAYSLRDLNLATETAD